MVIRTRAGRTRALLTATVAVVTLTACSGPSRGVVHDRRYEPAYTSTICHLVGKVMVCSPTYHPDSYSLDVYASADDHGWVNVDAASYHRCTVGSAYRDGDCS